MSRFDYEPLLVPGLLQTPAYMRTLITSRCPTLDRETIELHIEARSNRQALLDKTPLVQFSFIIGEDALRNPLGGAETMREQLEHLLPVGTQRNVEIQVMPSACGYTQGLTVHSS